MRKSGEIAGLFIIKEKGMPGIETDKVFVAPEGGIIGDRHCYNEDRQISLITRQAYDWMKKQETKGLCFRKFQANIVLDLEDQSIMRQRQIQAGEVVLALENSQKQCFEQCIRYQKGMDCMLKRQCWFATAVTEGQIRVGDPVSAVYNWNRYERQMMVPGIGRDEQERIKEGSVLVIGAGGLGCPALTVLSEAGVGRLGIVDGDVVEESNLNRQFLYIPSDIGKSKAECASRWVRTFRPDCHVDTYPERITQDNASRLMKDYDVILSAVDSISTRMLINDMAVLLGKPLIDGAIDGFYGTVTAVISEDSPCLACVNPSGREPGHISSSLGSTTMVIGALEAQMTLICLAELPLKSGNILSYDGLYGTLEEIPVVKNPECTVCGFRQK